MSEIELMLSKNTKEAVKFKNEIHQRIVDEVHSQFFQDIVTCRNIFRWLAEEFLNSEKETDEKIKRLLEAEED